MVWSLVLKAMPNSLLRLAVGTRIEMAQCAERRREYFD